MTIAYLNGEFMPLEEARISPMDRGFLFGDGIYEVIPSYDGRMVGFRPHITRMQEGLDAIEIKLGWDEEKFRQLCESLMEKNGNGNLGVYLHITRGADSKRHHAYPEGIEPTVFGYAFEIPAPPIPERDKIHPYTCATGDDMRWDRCNIKSISLLGNVMHYQQGHVQGDGEILLFNQANERASCYSRSSRLTVAFRSRKELLPGIKSGMPTKSGFRVRARKSFRWSNSTANRSATENPARSGKKPHVSTRPASTTSSPPTPGDGIALRASASRPLKTCRPRPRAAH